MISDKIDINDAFITMCDKKDVNDYHRCPVILHENINYYLGEFETKEQLDALAKKLGFTYELVENQTLVYKRFGNVDKSEGNWKVRVYRVSHKFAVGRVLHNSYLPDGRVEQHMVNSFWSLPELPKDAKPIFGLSNGRTVWCYFTNDGETITIYRPNPNAKDVYKPMTLEQDIAYRREHGTF